jgi:hypothetical protein
VNKVETKNVHVSPFFTNQVLFRGFLSGGKTIHNANYRFRFVLSGESMGSIYRTSNIVFEAVFAFQ